MSARDSILARVRKHCQPRSVAETTAQSSPTTPEPHPTLEQLTNQFEVMLDKVEASHERCESDDAARTAIARLCTEKKIRSLAVSDAAHARDLCRNLAIPCHQDADRSTLLETDAGLCTAQLGISETGTLVLDHDQERHREVSLLPPLHIAILRQSDIHPSLSTVLQSLNTRGESPPRAVTFITGASRTADIELTLIIGVHGPKAVHVIILENSP